MVAITRFEEIHAWQTARKLTNLLARFTVLWLISNPSRMLGVSERTLWSTMLNDKRATFNV